VLELAGGHGLDGQELYRKTGGNPFFVTEVLGASAQDIPDTIRDAVLARAARLSTDARRLLEAVAVRPAARKLEVVVLLADGLRNAEIAEIAERLIVSEKTVDHHVSAILRKLDVRTRGEAGAEATRLGLTEST
jgi:DNA-binding CsgD family transcriptional regulator